MFDTPAMYLLSLIIWIVAGLGNFIAFSKTGSKISMLFVFLAAFFIWYNLAQLLGYI